MGILKQEQKLKRQEYLQAILHKYTQTEPALSLKEISEVLIWEVGDITDLLKALKKEMKKDSEKYSKKVERELSVY